MTVGIATICEGNRSESPAVILAADRLVTTGYSTRIEYEHTNTKITEIVNTDSLTAFAVASGSLSLADDLFLKIEEEIIENPPSSVRAIVEEGVDAFHRLEHETFSNQVLGPLDISLDDLKSGDLALAPEYQRAMLQDIFEKKEEIESNLTVLIGGVDSKGPHIYSLEKADLARHDNIGYATIGSGSLSAQLTFTRNRYDTECSFSDALMTAVEAKARAEEAQGVGKKMDIAVIRDSEIELIQGDNVERLRELQEEIGVSEYEARRNTIENSNIEYLEE